MAHNHSHAHHGHSHHHHDHSTGNISTAFFLNAVFVVIELVGGLLTNSIAILSDALHDLGDCLSLALAWFLQRKSQHKRDSHYSYGYKRFSLLGGVFLSGVLTVSSVFIIYEAVMRLFSPQDVDAHGMLWLAILGIIINGAAALRVKRGTSLNERAVYLHIMEDVLGWVAVLVVSIVMMFAYIPILDPILSICISMWVLSHVWGNLKSAFQIMLQSVPESVNVDELREEILKIGDVQSVHDLHLWSMDGEEHVMTLHVVSDTDNPPALKHEIIAIANNHHITHTTIEMEHAGDECSTNCDEIL